MDISGKLPFDQDQALMSLVIVRTDITMAQQMVQACHASSMAGAAFDGWSENTRMALLATDSEDAMIEVANKLKKHGIAFCDFFEPDHGLGLTAIACAPIPWGKARKALPHLPLWVATKLIV